MSTERTERLRKRVANRRAGGRTRTRGFSVARPIRADNRKRDRKRWWLDNGPRMILALAWIFPAVFLNLNEAGIMGAYAWSNMPWSSVKHEVGYVQAQRVEPAAIPGVAPTTVPTPNVMEMPLPLRPLAAGTELWDRPLDPNLEPGKAFTSIELEEPERFSIFGVWGNEYVQIRTQGGIEGWVKPKDLPYKPSELVAVLKGGLEANPPTIAQRKPASPIEQ
jgi:hypothetical protein